MFDKLKQLKQLKDLQNAVGQEKAEVEKNGIKIVLNGKLEVEEIRLNPSLGGAEQEKILKEVFNEVIKKINLQIAQKMMKLPGFGM